MKAREHKVVQSSIWYTQAEHGLKLCKKHIKRLYLDAPSSCLKNKLHFGDNSSLLVVMFVSVSHIQYIHSIHAISSVFHLNPTLNRGHDLCLTLNVSG